MKNIKKISSILIIGSMTAVLLGGCSSAKPVATAKPTSTIKPIATSQTGNKMKKLYADTLKTLVIAGTITQAQSDKVLEAETKIMPKVTRTGKSAGTTAEAGTTQPSGAINANGRKFSNNKLNALVTSGVITQAQANTINQSLQDVMKNNKSTQTNQKS